jgi:hypothetical protein
MYKSSMERSMLKQSIPTSDDGFPKPTGYTVYSEDLPDGGVSGPGAIEALGNIEAAMEHMKNLAFATEYLAECNSSNGEVDARLSAIYTLASTIKDSLDVSSKEMEIVSMFCRSLCRRIAA